MKNINTRAFYKMSEIRESVSLKLSDYKINELTEEAKSFPKKSKERIELNLKIKSITGSEEYRLLKKELDTIDFPKPAYLWL